MSSAVFFHNLSELNWKPWALASSLALLAATYSLGGTTLNSVKAPCELSIKGKQAETRGQFRQARQNFDLALLRARARGDKAALITALLDCARIDIEFEEQKLAATLAQEAADLSETFYGKRNIRTAEAIETLADVIADEDKALALYKTALSITTEHFGNNDLRRARILLSMSNCYDALGMTPQAISACKSSMNIFEKSKTTSNPDYGRALVQYSSIADIEQAEKTSLQEKALAILENSSGANHPELALTLGVMASSESAPDKKISHLARARNIDASIFGDRSIRVARDLVALADVYDESGKKKEAHELRREAASIFGNSDSLPAMSNDFLQSYARLLHQLNFQKEASRLDNLLLLEKAGVHASDMQENNGQEIDIENDVEYWQRTELVPVENVDKFASECFDHIQLWYDKGTVRLEAYFEGEKTWVTNVAECPTGILNAGADKDTITISWRDGDGPIWHNDCYKIGNKAIKLISSNISDAYSQQINVQVQAVIDGDSGALNNGAVESVPATYINNNFVADAIRRAEHKALELYGQGDPAAAAERLSMMFDLTTKAIDTQRSEINQALTRQESWVDAWKYQQIPLSDYITALNDYGFFLQQTGCHKESAVVFSLVLGLSPARSVAYLNLGDSYWALGNKPEALKCYKIYLSLSKGSHKESNVPSRVLRRTAAGKLSPVSIKMPLLLKSASLRV